MTNKGSGYVVLFLLNGWLVVWMTLSLIGAKSSLDKGNSKEIGSSIEQRFLSGGYLVLRIIKGNTSGD